MDTTAPERFALFPLTPFDTNKLYERTTFVTGWLVQGSIDAVTLAAALSNITRKWRMLSGRIHSVKEGDVMSWYLKTPTGPIPYDYPTFALTTSISELPLSHYVPVPLPLLTSSLPPSLFIHPQTPLHFAIWESKNHPLTCWHLTHFPAETNEGQSYTCIGFARSHGVFDGVGASFVMQALVAEMQGRDWDAPPMPSDGINANPVLDELNAVVEAQERANSIDEDFCGYADGLKGALQVAAWHLREKWWRGAARYIVLLPKNVLTSLVDGVRKELQRENHSADRVTTGDVMVAWIMKTLYSSGTSPNAVVHCSNMGSFRPLLSKSNDALKYPHNAFIPLPYHPIKVADLQSLPLDMLAHLFAVFRSSMSLSQVASAFKVMTSTIPSFPIHPDAEETLLVSNVSASRILESDWTAAGGLRTLCGYRYQVTRTDLLWTNAVYIAGRLSDGSTVLDVTLNKTRIELLTAEVQRLISEASVPK